MTGAGWPTWLIGVLLGGLALSSLMLLGLVSMWVTT